MEMKALTAVTRPALSIFVSIAGAAECVALTNGKEVKQLKAPTGLSGNNQEILINAGMVATELVTS
jgi:hypothetical protein